LEARASEDWPGIGAFEGMEVEICVVYFVDERFLITLVLVVFGFLVVYVYTLVCRVKNI
jgi:hypothetical protein